MRKAKIFLLLTLSIMLFGAMGVFAYTKEGSGDWRGSKYNVQLSGTRTTMSAVGTDNEVYTTMLNKSTSSYYMYAGIYKYDYNKCKLILLSENKATAKPGCTMDSKASTRYKYSYVVDYHHFGKVYVAQGTSSYYEDFRYIANQYYR